MTESCDVIVVGAGLAGLTAARSLARAGIDVRVLEARDRVGGRMLNHRLGNGEIVEAGGQFVGPTQNHVIDLARSYGLEMFPAYDEGAHGYVHAGQVKRFDNGAPPDLLALPDLAIATRRINHAAKMIPVHAPWTAEHAIELDRITFDSWLRQFSLGDGAVDLVNVFLGSAFGATASEVSALFALWYIAGAGDERTPGTIERMTSVAGGAQQWRFGGGSQLIASAIAEELGDRVTLSAPVRAIRQDERAVTVVSDAGTWTADRVVVAVPPHLAARIQWTPTLPAAQDALFQRLSFGTLMKCEAVYDRPFWRDQELSGQGVFRAGRSVCSMFDNTPAGGSPGVLLGFVGGDQWRAWSRRPPRDRRGAVLRSFADVVGDRALRPVDYFEQDWTAEEWTRGGPCAIAGPGVLTTLGTWRDAPFGRVHWAGAEHSDYWNGYMEGAVRSGNAVAEAIVSIEKRRDAA
jgi:monoamine oxidase